MEAFLIQVLFVNAGFRHGSKGIFALLEYYTAFIGSQLLTFGDYKSVAT